MMESYPVNKDFWQDLIRDEKVDSELWNRFLIYKYPRIVKPIIVDEEPNKLWFDISQMSQVQFEEIEEIEERHGKPPIINNTFHFEHIMDFFKFVSVSDISFARRILIGADFRNLVFNGTADFGETVFLGITHFEGAYFLVKNLCQ